MYRGRRRTSKRSYRPRRSYKRAAKKQFRKFASRVLRVANEKKFVELLTGVGAPAATANNDILTVCLTGVLQGDTDNTRDGNMLALRSLEIHVRAIVNQAYLAKQATLTGTAADNPWTTAAGDANQWFNDKVRLLIWQWLPSSDSASAAGGALPGSVLQQETTISPYNHDERRNFRILADRSARLAGNYIHLENQVFMVDGFPTHELADFKIRIRKFGTRNVQWLGGGSSIVANGHIYMSVITDWSEQAAEPPATGEYPVLVYYDLKTNFSDK